LECTHEKDSHMEIRNMLNWNVLMKNIVTWRLRKTKMTSFLTKKVKMKRLKQNIFSMTREMINKMKRILIQRLVILNQ